MTVAEPASMASAVVEPANLPERPPLSDPSAGGDGVGNRGADPRQPRLGLLGLLFVVPNALLLALAWGGIEGSTVVLGPLVTFSLPLVVMVSFFWEDWPGTRLRASLSGWVDTLLIVVGAVILTAIGQAIVGGFHLAGIFDTSPPPGSVPTFPASLAIGGIAFVAMLQITLVGEGWPLRKLPGLSPGVVAVVATWAVALIVFFTLAGIEAPPGSGVTARGGPIAGPDLGAAGVMVGVLQVLFYVIWRGWPFAGITGTAARLLVAHAVTICGGIALFLLGRHAFGIDPHWIGAAAGCFIAAGIVLGMQFDGWVARLLAPGPERVVLLLAVIGLACAFGGVTYAIASGFDYDRITPQDWVEHVALNAIAVSAIAHVAIGRRWPFGEEEGVTR
jgi:hypothetical protein